MKRKDARGKPLLKTTSIRSRDGCKNPCKGCPYRKDSPLALWDKNEFDRLSEAEKTQMGSLYACHKNDGSLCRGWFITQREKGYPSLVLRIFMMQHNFSMDETEAICAPEGVDLYPDVDAMREANFPGGICRNRPLSQKETMKLISLKNGKANTGDQDGDRHG
jgi:hypothetical protein